MSAQPERLLLPGWAATARMYGAGLPPDWTVLELPSFRATKGELQPYVDWLGGELAQRDGPTVVAGHSLGGAIAVLAAAEHPDRVARLVLVSPSVLPLVKSAPASFRDLGIQVARGRFHLSDLAVAGTRLAVAPRPAARLASHLRRLDLSAELQQVRDAGVDAAVIACTTDTLVTCDHCGRAARLLGASYRELALDGGHLWMFAHPVRFADVLQAPV
jgi:pimeloyl-ACP methyl ester carboxylesterase